LNKILISEFWEKHNCVKIYRRKSKEIIDEIDIVLGEHYGFDKQEIDYIINYDIGFRMSKD